MSTIIIKFALYSCVNIHYQWYFHSNILFVSTNVTFCLHFYKTFVPLLLLLIPFECGAYEYALTFALFQSYHFQSYSRTISIPHTLSFLCFLYISTSPSVVSMSSQCLPLSPLCRPNISLCHLYVVPISPSVTPMSSLYLPLSRLCRPNIFLCHL